MFQTSTLPRKTIAPPEAKENFPKNICRKKTIHYSNYKEREPKLNYKNTVTIRRSARPANLKNLSAIQWKQNIGTLCASKCLLKISKTPGTIQKKYYSDDVSFLSLLSKLSAKEIDQLNRGKQRMRLGCNNEEIQKKRQAQPICAFEDEYDPPLKWCDHEDLCLPCSTPQYLKDVPLKRLQKKTPKEDRPVCPPPERIPRLDDNLKLVKKKLPRLKLDVECKPCEDPFQSVLPELRRPKKFYDDTEMKWKHICTPAILCPPRLDDENDLIYKPLTKYKMSGECKPCVSRPPSYLPRLVRPVRKFEDVDLPRPCENVEPCIRPPEVQIRKKLPKLDVGECIPCYHYTETRRTELKRLKKRYDDSLMEFPKKCKYIEPCPPRMDEGYREKRKPLKKYLQDNDCIPCASEPCAIVLPKLRRLRKAYDDSLFPYPCEPPVDPCHPPPPRLDDGLELKYKKLPRVPIGECQPCTAADQYKMGFPLKRLKKNYDDTQMLFYTDECLPPERMPRLDDDLVFRTHKLPKLCLSECVPCKDKAPVEAPPIPRPRRRFEDADRPPCIDLQDLCNIDPPRLDDLCCYKKKVKRLPPFTAKCFLEDCGKREMLLIHQRAEQDRLAEMERDRKRVQTMCACFKKGDSAFRKKHNPSRDYSTHRGKIRKYYYKHGDCL